MLRALRPQPARYPIPMRQDARNLPGILDARHDLQPRPAASFSVMTHFDALQRGVIDLRDVAFFLSVIGFALFANAVIVRGLRAG